MKRSGKKQIIWLSLLILTVLLLPLTGCAGEQNDEWPAKIRIGYLRVPNDETIAKAKAIFDDYFTPYGISCEFIIFDSGVDANKALLANSIDFATMGDTNGVIALATGLDVELIWIHEVLGDAEQLVARQDSGISTVADLAGRKVATVFASTAHFSLLHALRDAGIEEDVTLLDMQTADIVAAWQRGDIDAAYTWQPTLDELLREGVSLVTSLDMADRGVVTANVLLARRGFSQTYPQLTADFISALADAGDLYRTDADSAAAVAAQELGISPDVAATQMLGSRWLTREDALSADFMGTTQEPGHFTQVILDTAEFLADQSSIDQVPPYEDIVDFVNPAYIEQSLGSADD